VIFIWVCRIIFPKTGRGEFCRHSEEVKKDRMCENSKLANRSCSFYTQTAECSEVGHTHMYFKICFSFNREIIEYVILSFICIYKHVSVTFV